MVGDVLARVAEDTGLNDVDQRSLLLRHINNAASWMYKQLECNAIYREVSLLVPVDKVISLPSYIGELRGMRIHTNEMPFNLNSIGNPRYTATTWNYKFRNWRDLGESPIKLSLNDVSTLNIVSNVVETDPVSLVISGQTNNALREEETILLNAGTVTTSKNFGPAIYSISCNKPRSGDIFIQDANGNEIAVLYNTDNRTRYKIMDVSQLPWPIDTADGSSIIDVCYKHPLYRFVNDSDQFPAGDNYDDAWYFMTMHLYYKPMQDRQQDATSFFGQAEAALVAVKESSEGFIMKKLNFGRNKFYGLFRRWRYFPGSPTNVDIPSNPPN